MPYYSPRRRQKETKYTLVPYGEMFEDNFSGELKGGLQINYGIVQVLPIEYVRVSEVSEVEEYFLQDKEAS